MESSLTNYARRVSITPLWSSSVLVSSLSRICHNSSSSSLSHRSYSALFSSARNPQCASISSRWSGPRSRKVKVVSATRGFQTSSIAQSSPQFSYRISAAFSAKGRNFDPNNNLYNYTPGDKTPCSSMEHGSPRRKKKHRPASGQDSFFVSSVGDGPNVAFGVADGVGGYSASRIDSADFSHGLCEYMAAIARNCEEKYGSKAHWGHLSPQSLMEIGYGRALQDRTIAGGGTTACVAIGRDDGNLDVANLGDSGFIQLRLNAIHYASHPQTHAFNTPYQLAIVPPKLLAQAALFGGRPLVDLPTDSNISTHQLRHGDILVFATDGVWDNLAASDILRLVSRHMKACDGWTADEEQGGVVVGENLDELTALSKETAEKKEAAVQSSNNNNNNNNKAKSLQALLATSIAREAKQASINTKLDGPFAKEVRKYYPHEDYRGGKVDDICVVVAVAVAADA
ncbi:MAG: hypothetical protein M1819_004623 [Sarea resinae]|nr:MAG: hypothetical protein M1819_004623 [Sarea resinae]